MSEWYPFKRRDVGTNVELTDGEYRVTPKHQVLWKCPKCSVLLRLVHENHTIKYDGTIHPSIKCPQGQCDFHEWVYLEGWVPASKGLA